MGRDDSTFTQSSARRRTRLSIFRRAWLRYVLPGACLVALLGGGGFAALETTTVESYWEGLWWALSLVTTVGFVHGAPSTPAGQALSGTLMVFGFVLLAMTTAAVASLFVRDEEQPRERLDQTLTHELLVEVRNLSGRIARVEASLLGDAGTGTSDPSREEGRGATSEPPTRDGSQ